MTLFQKFCTFFFLIKLYFLRYRTFSNIFCSILNTFYLFLTRISVSGVRISSYRAPCSYCLARPMSMIRRMQACAGMFWKATDCSASVTLSQSYPYSHFELSLSMLIRISVSGVQPAGRMGAPARETRKPIAPHYVLTQSPPVFAFRAVALHAHTVLPVRIP